MQHKLKSAFSKVLHQREDELTTEEIEILDGHLSDTHSEINTTADLITELEQDRESYNRGENPLYVESYDENTQAAFIRKECLVNLGTDIQ